MKFAVCLLWVAALAAAPRVTLMFDADWCFFKGDSSGAAARQFADAEWRSLADLLDVVEIAAISD